MAERMETTETELIGAHGADEGESSTTILHERIAERISRYVEPDTISSVCTAVLSGQVVRVDADVPPGAGIIALRHGILFLPDGEYRVEEE
jgi:hypothetical protein